MTNSPRRSKTIVISDIHIGDNSRTCWYQRDFHEPYLLAVLDYVMTKRDEIDQLIILGDLFDFWTYSPTVQPPSTQKILDANPKVFGKDGKLPQMVDTLQGRVLYLRGNHDINIIQADLDKIPGQYRIRMAPDIYTKGKVTYTHGHLFTLFNAPPVFSITDPKRPPCGHFVTRAVSQLVESKLLGPGQTIADLPGWGAPGISMNALISILSLEDPGAVAPAFLEFMRRESGMGLKDPITLIDGRQSSFEEAKKTYTNLWSEWVDANGGGERGQAIAYKAVWADKDGSYLGWFAERLRRQADSDVVVMGHTHTPLLGLLSKYGGPHVGDYVNSGFLCPAKPDLNTGQRFTFSEVVDDGNGPVKTTMMRVEHKDGRFQILPHDCGNAAITFPPSRDFSCYVEVENQTAKTLLIKGAPRASSGQFAVEPPQSILPGTTAMFWAQDFSALAPMAVGATVGGTIGSWWGASIISGALGAAVEAITSGGLEGTAGEVTYTAPAAAANSGDFTLKFGCPSNPFSDNYSSGPEYSSRVESGEWQKNTVQSKGNPIFIKYTISSPLLGSPVKQLETSLQRSVVWGVTPSNNLVRWNGKSWDTVADDITHVAVGSSSEVWALSEAPADKNNIRRWIDGVWIQVDGHLTDIGVGADGTVWGVNTNRATTSENNVYRWNGAGWDLIEKGFFTNIAVGNAKEVWAINTRIQAPENNIFHWNGANWTRIPGYLTSIGAGADGTVWGVNDNLPNKDGNVYRWNGTGWDGISVPVDDGTNPVHYTQVAVGDFQNTCGVKANGRVYHWQGSDWKMMDGNLKSISVRTAVR